MLKKTGFPKIDNMEKKKENLNQFGKSFQSKTMQMLEERQKDIF